MDQIKYKQKYLRHVIESTQITVQGKYERFEFVLSSVDVVDVGERR